MGVLEWYESIWGTQGQKQSAVQTMPAFIAEESLELYWKSLPENVTSDPGVKAAYQAQKVKVAGLHAGIENPLGPVILGMLNDWKEKVAKYDIDNPANASEKLAGLAADVLAISAAAGVIELTLGALPNGEGAVASMKVSDTMKWLGFGAVVTAVAHDPVKIGLLRPYQDSLEAHFRNRRPMDMQLFQAYKTRELSPSKPTLEELNDDKAIDKIEAENQEFYDREIAKWGYSEWFAGALARSATVTLNFSQLSALARQGLLSRGLAAYSLWGQGLDRVVMKPALDALMEQNKIANYEGFRAQIEPAYVEGIVSEAELVEYWGKINVPADVQAAMLPRFRKKRQAFLTKSENGAPAKERDLTLTQVQQAYEAELLDRARAQNMILDLGYSKDETDILLTLADMRKKLPGATKLKRLPLTDYEKAHKNGLISLDEVLARMKGEYTAEDIDLERKLLEIGKA